MDTAGKTILITGGASGIGLATARALLESGSTVLVCARRERQLDVIAGSHPRLHTRVCDIANADEREALFQWAVAGFPDISILVNNAGIQRQIDFTAGAGEYLAGEDEIETNLRAVIHLSALFIPHFRASREAAIVNISSGLGFIPIAILPVYCATKAALHSFSISLRHQLRDTSVRVFEIIPPTVDTELDKGARQRRGQSYRGIDPAEVASATVHALASDTHELAIGQAAALRSATGAAHDEAFNRMNTR